MRLTNVLLKKAKGRLVLVSVQSVATGHKYNRLRERTADKLEVVLFDPYAQAMSVYKEVRRVRNI